MIIIRWTCSDFVHHQHSWCVTAWFCGMFQKFFITPIKLMSEKVIIMEDIR